MDFGLRKHQQELDDCLAGHVSGEAPIPGVLLDVTPGGGKSLLPILALKRLKEAGLVDKLCWIVPRSSLQTQGAEDFLDPAFREALGHDLLINEATNAADPSRGTNGFATTYQAISQDSSGINAAEFQCARYLLVLDEVHHVRDGGTTHKALIPLHDRAAFVIYMTGTLARHDQKKIAFLNYKEVVAC